MNERIKLTSTISKTIKTGREERKMTQSALALKANVPRARVKRIEGMELNTVDMFELERLIRVLGVKLPLKKTTAKKTTKKVAKKATATKKKATKKTTKKVAKKKPTARKKTPATLSRKEVLSRLESVGLADLKLRDLLTLKG